MNALQRLLVQFFGIFVSVGVGVLVMIYGWGLEPKSWWWILGFGIAGHWFAILIVAIGQIKD